MKQMIHLNYLPYLFYIFINFIFFRLKGLRRLGCHTIQKITGKFPKLRCILSAKLVTDSLVRSMKEFGITLRQLP